MKISMECSLCEKQLRFPVTTTTCRHNFCSQCVFVYLKTVKDDEIKCAKCGKGLKRDDFREDKSLNEVFRNLEKTRELQSNELSNEKMHLYLEYYQLNKELIQKVGAPCLDKFELFLPRSTKIEAVRAELNARLRFKKKKSEPFCIKVMNNKQNKEYPPQTTLGTVAFEYGKFDNLRIYFTISLSTPNRVIMSRTAVQGKSPCAPSSSTALSVAPPKIINELQTTNKKIAMSSPLAERSTTISPTTSTNVRISDGPPLIKSRPPAPPRIISPRSSTTDSLTKEDDKRNGRPPMTLETPLSVKQAQQQRPPSPNKIFDTASLDVNMCRFISHVHFHGDRVVFEPALIEAVMRMSALVIDGQRCVFYVTPFGLALMLEPQDQQMKRVADYLRNPLEYSLEERPPKTSDVPLSFIQVGRASWTKDPRWMRVYTLDLAFIGKNQELGSRPMTCAPQDRSTIKVPPYKVTIINPYEWPNVIQTIHPMSLKQRGPPPMIQPTPEGNGLKGPPICQSANTTPNTVKSAVTVPVPSTMNTTRHVKENSIDDELKPEPLPVVSSTYSPAPLTGTPFGRVHTAKSFTPPPTTLPVTIAKPPMLIIAPTTSANSKSSVNHVDWSEEKPPALKSMAAEEPDRPTATGGLTFKQLIEQRKQAKQQECRTTQPNNPESGKRKRRLSTETETKPEAVPSKKRMTPILGTPPPALQPMTASLSNLIPTTVPPGSTVHFVIPSTASSNPATAAAIMSHPGHPTSSGAPDVTSAMIQNIGAQFKQNPQMAPVMILPPNATMPPNYGYINTPNGPTPAVISTTASGKPTFLLPNGMQLVHCSDMPSNFIRMDPPAGYQAGAHFTTGMPPLAMQAVFGRANIANNKMMGGQCGQMPRMKSPPMMVTPPHMQMLQQQHHATSKQQASNGKYGQNHQLGTPSMKRQHHRLSLPVPGVAAPTPAAPVPHQTIISLRSLNVTQVNRLGHREIMMNTGGDYRMLQERHLRLCAFIATDQKTVDRQRRKYARRLYSLAIEGDRMQKERMARLEESRKNEVMRREKNEREREAAMRAMAVLKAEKTPKEEYNKNTALSVDTKTTPAVIGSLLSTGSKPSPSLAAMPVLSSMSPTAGASVDTGAGNNSAQMPQLCAETDDGPPMLEAVGTGPPTKKLKPNESEGLSDARCPSLDAVHTELKPVSAISEALNNSRTMGPPNTLNMSGIGSFNQGQIPGYIFKPEKPSQKEFSNVNQYGDLQRMKDMLRSSELTRSTMKQLMANHANLGQSQNTFSFMAHASQYRKNLSEESRLPPAEKSQPPPKKMAPSPSNSMSCFTSLRPPIASISPQPEERSLTLPAVQMFPIRAGGPSTVPNTNVFKRTEASVFAPKRSLDTMQPTPPPSTSAESIDFRALANMKGQTLGKTLKETFFNKRKSTDGPRPSVSPSKSTDPSQAMPSLTASQ